MSITRRGLLGGTAAVAAAVAAPAVITRPSFGQSSGSVRVYAWLDYVQPNIVEAFENETGIQVELSTYGSNDEAMNTLQANGGTGFDVIFPSITNTPGYQSPDAPNGIYLTPLDMGRINSDNIIAAFLRDSASLGGVHNGEQVVLPFDWGTEGVTLNRARLPIADEDISFGDLWRPEAEGAAAFRQKSVLIGTGLYLDATGEGPSNRMLDVYRSEEEARRVFGAVAQWIVEHRQNFGAFWNNATEATAAFNEAGCIIGQTWDTTGLLLNRDNGDFVYRAPREGIITWMDSVGIPSGAANVDEAYAFINFLLTPEIGGMFSNNTGYNSAVVGAADFASEEFARQFNEVYRPDVLSNMWWWQADTPFFAPLQNEFVEIITSA